MLIGSGPIVIGQACEFDYSGTQACKALQEEGYRVVLVNSNPATIMTDPDFADATYVEPIDAAILEQHHRARAARRAAAHPRRTDGPEPRHRARRDRRPRPLRGRAHRRDADAIEKAEDREPFKAGHGRDRPRRPAHRGRPTHGRGRAGVAEPRPAADHPPLVHPGRDGHRHRGRPTTSSRRRAGGLDASPIDRDPHRGVDRRLEGVRARGHARRRATTSSSSARSRTSTPWACTPATRSRWRPPRRSPTWSTSSCATPRSRASDGSASRPAARTSSSRSNPTNGDMVVIEMNPRVSRSSALAIQGDRVPDRQDRREARGGLHARRDPQRHHQGHTGQLRADDRLRRHQGPALGVREVPRHPRGPRHPDAVGRRGHGDRSDVPRVAAEGAALAGARPVRPERRPGRGAHRPARRRRAAGGGGDRHARPALPARGRAATRDERRRGGVRHAGRSVVPRPDPPHHRGARPPRGGRARSDASA